MIRKFTVRKRPGTVEKSIGEDTMYRRPAERGEYLFDITIRGNDRYVEEVKALLKQKYDTDETYVD